MRELLQDHGDLVDSEHESIDALVVKLHSADVGELADRDEVAALTLDSDVYADGAKPAETLKKLVGKDKKDKDRTTADRWRSSSSLTSTAAGDARTAEDRDRLDADRLDRHRRRHHRFRH